MSEIEKIFKKWKVSATQDSDLIKELTEIEHDNSKVMDRFYKDLDFGTAGVRGIIGAGINRMNVYVVGRITKAFAVYLNRLKSDSLVVIGFDNRIKSEFFAKTAAQVLAANGVRVKIFRELKPVPILSYAVRYFNCDGGIMITASHNPSDYNGYKLYGDDGCQIVDDVAEKISGILSGIDMFDFDFGSFEEGLNSGLISFCGDEVEQSFLQCVEQNLIQPEILNGSDLSLVYTPLNGSGMEPIYRLLKKFNIGSVYVVREQQNPDGNFPTCKIPNPEQIEAFDLAMNYCKVHKPDVAIATDPDCDRIGVVVLDSRTGDYRILNGNQIGVLMFDYVCKRRLKLGKMPNNPVAITTIVSTPMAGKIAEHYGVKLENVLTGFKYIGKRIGKLESAGEQNRFIFGFEESQGYLAGSYIRDKDGVFASMLVCEMVEFYKLQKRTLIDVLNEIYEKFGYYKSSVQSYVFQGKDGMTKMSRIMDYFRMQKVELIGNFKVKEVCDYLLSEKRDLSGGVVEEIDLPKSNVVEFRLYGDLKIVVRVSGTEPKIKVYYHALGRSAESAAEAEIMMQNGVTRLIDSFSY